MKRRTRPTTTLHLEALFVLGIFLWPPGQWALGDDVPGEGDPNSNLPYVDSDPGEVEMGNPSVLIEVDGYHAGHCWVCDEYADYSCSPWGSYPGWGWPTSVGFNDPVPAGMIVAQIEATVNAVGCPGTGGSGASMQTTVLVNATVLGSVVQGGSCGCGTCFPAVVSSSTYPSGLPGYVYGGTNELILQVNGVSCITDVHLELFYESANELPVCYADGPYSAECQGLVTSVQLDGTGSFDPDDDPLTYLWETDCPGGSFDDPTSPTPILTVDTAPGCNVTCNVTLTVDDSTSTDTCSTTVSIADTTAPTLSGVPTNGTVGCDAVPPPANPTATDNCDPSPSIAFNEAATGGACPGFTLTRTWTATDACGNSTAATQVITVLDTTLADLQFAEDPVSVILPPNTTDQVVVQIENTGSCPTQVTGIEFNTDFTTPAVSVITTAPLTLCPGQTANLTLEIDTTDALDGLYCSVLKLTGEGDPGEVSAIVDVRVSSDLKPDLTPITSSGGVTITGANGPPPVDASEAFTIAATVSNIGVAPASAFQVNFFDGTTLLGGTEVVAGLAIGGTTNVQLNVAGGSLAEGFHVIRVEVVPPDEGEMSTDNNATATYLQVGSLPVGDAVIGLSASATQGCVGSVVYVTGRADYFLVSDTGGVVDFPVQGGKVTVTILDESGTNVVGSASTVHTLITGSFLQPISAPAPGNYIVRVEVTDFSLTGETETPLVVLSAADCIVGGSPGQPGNPPPFTPPPPGPGPSVDLFVCSGDILFLGDDCETPVSGNPDPGDTVCIRSTIHMFGASSVSNQPVSFTAHVQEGDGFSAQLIETELVTFVGGGSVDVAVLWTIPTGGEHVVEVALEPTVGQFRGNDVATRGIRVGTPPEPVTDIVVTADAGGCGARVNVAGRALYTGSSESTLSSIPVGCGIVTATLFDAADPGVPLSSSTGAHTDRNGWYRTSITTGGLAPGTYIVRVDISDGTLVGSVETSFVCLPPGPDPIAPPAPVDVFLFAEDIAFLGDGNCLTGLFHNPFPGVEVGVGAIIHYFGAEPLLGQPVTVTEHIPIGDALQAFAIGSASVDFPTGSGIATLCVPWTPQTAGTRIVQVAVNPTVPQFELNDAATRAIAVGSALCQLELDATDVTVVRGESGVLTITGTDSTDITPTLELSVAPVPPNDLPSGVTATFEPPSPLTLPFTTTLAISTDATTPPGRHPLFIVGVGEGCTAIATLTMIVANQPPQCDAGGSYAGACQGVTTMIALDGTGSFDPDGDPLTYLWETDCPGGSFDDPTSATPVLTVDTAPGCSVTCNVTLTVDDGIDTDNCSGTVTIGDTTPPMITCPGDLTVECDGAGNAPDVTEWLSSASASDVCGSATISNSFTGLSDDCGATGSATVTFTAVDNCGNESACSATITVVDTTAPGITCPGNLTVECDGAGNAPDVDAWLSGASASDLCGSATISNDFTGLSDDCGATGSGTVTFTTVDNCGNQSTCSATITVVDTTAPDITCPGNLTVECDGGGNTAELNAWLASASASDVCGSVTLGNDFAGLSDDCGPTGSATATFTAVDNCGNESTCSATITVVDTTAPVITCPADATVTCGEPTDPGATGSATAADICDPAAGISFSDVVTPTSCPGDPVRETITRTWTATDVCGNSSSCVQTITVDKVVLHLDIKPESCPNGFNPTDNGHIPVALVGTPDFDVATVDLASIRVSRADCVGGSVPASRFAFEDAATPFSGNPCDCHDLGGDGIIDLSIKFRAPLLVEVLELRDMPPATSIPLVLTGQLLDGCGFIATDCLTRRAMGLQR